MGLSTNQIVKIRQLRLIGNKTAFKICQIAEKEIIDSNNVLMEFILDCIAKNLISGLPEYSSYDFETAFARGEKIIEDSTSNKIKILSYYDNDFPELLRDITDAPIILNFKGVFKEINQKIGIAIIGTRDPTNNGIRSGEIIGEFFGKKGFNVVSGLAKGCDSAAHRGCIKGNGYTTAIVAHGLQTVYPKENKKLAEEIVSKGGVIMSEYFYGETARKSSFVERDRLQAGLSKATIVIQTGIKGGTMHAVNATIKSQKLLAAVKYLTEKHSEKTLGNDRLINQKNAFALTSSNLEEFAGKIQQVTQPKLTALPQTKIATKAGKKSKKGKSKRIDKDQYTIDF